MPSHCCGNYREPGMMKRRGEPCELPGVRDTDATDELYVDSRQKLRFAKQWNDFKKMPWTSEGSINAKVARGVLRALLFSLPCRRLVHPLREEAKKGWARRYQA